MPRQGASPEVRPAASSVTARDSTLTAVTVIRALADTSVFRASRVADLGVFPMTDGSGQRIVRIARKPPPDGAWLRQQIESLPTMARLARENRLSMCNYSELEREAMHGEIQSPLVGELFAGLTWEDLPAALERSKVQQLEIPDRSEEENMVKFCKCLLTTAAKVFDERFRVLFSDFERRNLGNLARFREMCADLQTGAVPRRLSSLDGGGQRPRLLRARRP
jgi:hypothetical protein